MKRGSGSGNGASGQGCPHDCVRCRAIEAGLDSRPLTQSEFLSIHELVESSREDRVEWSQETREAQLAAEVAQIAYEDARREWLAVTEKAEAARQDELRWLNDLEKQRREQEIERAQRGAREELEQQEKALLAARIRYHDLAGRDSETHRRAVLAASVAAADARREERLSETRKLRRGAIVRLVGGNGRRA
jgi:hypothetical protein